MISCFPISSSSPGAESADAPAFAAFDISDIQARKSIPGRAFSASLLLAICLAILLPACVRQQQKAIQKEAAEAETWTSGDLRLPDRPDAPRRIYVEAREDGQPLPISKNLEAALTGKEFAIVDSPSDAGYILNINILRRGEVDPAAMRGLVEAGYDAPSRFAGSGGAGMLVDALLVQRRVPSTKRPSHARLQHTSARNAMESAQMRLGAAISGAAPGPETYAALSRSLAAALRDSLSGSKPAGSGQ